MPEPILKDHGDGHYAIIADNCIIRLPADGSIQIDPMIDGAVDISLYDCCVSITQRNSELEQWPYMRIITEEEKDA